MQTDLNQRERRRYASQMRAMARSLEQCAPALESEDDIGALAALIVWSMLGPEVVKELTSVFKETAEVERAKRDLDTEPPADA